MKVPSHGDPLQNLLQLTKDLRSPEGCPWDREQNHLTIIPHLLEESYEVIEAIETRDDENLKEELGDLLFHILFHAELAAERNAFQFKDVVQTVFDKLVRRHPHVYQEKKGIDSDAVVKQWDAIKEMEKAKQNKKEESILDGIPKSFPAILRSEKIQKKVSKVGFDWDHPLDIFDKLKEEIQELQDAIGPSPKMDGNKIAYQEDIEDELGDILFVLVNLAGKLSIQPEVCLRKANQKFETRFRTLEQILRERNETFQDKPLSELDLIWEEAKQRIKAQKDSASSGSPESSKK
ncbi:MazG family protein [Leptospira ryugenii]|uniref:MazG family protein n=1 Tax=Leptospira ryugenii TaxID=1917863 RepID=A0A2P2DZK6_9LEPT|nr:nucleoside triphosphate pyrophosphohydrolase [Leptospira ryugenii]GBF50058.1 MazG family protein [Leptospira ryugenii]